MPFQHYRTTWQMSNAGVVEQKDLGLGKSVNQNNIEFAQVADVVSTMSGSTGTRQKQQEPPEVACQPLPFSILILSPQAHRTFSILHPCSSLLSS